MACIGHFCFIKIKVMAIFLFTISRGQNFVVFTKTANINPRGILFLYFSFRKAPNEKYFFQSNPMTFLFPLSLSHFIILLTLKYLLMFFDFDISRTRRHFAFGLQMFTQFSFSKSNPKIFLRGIL